MKKIWTKPALQTLETPKGAAAYAQGKATAVENEKVEKLLKQMRASRGDGTEPIVLRRSARR